MNEKLIYDGSIYSRILIVLNFIEENPNGLYLKEIADNFGYQKQNLQRKMINPLCRFKKIKKIKVGMSYKYYPANML